MSNRMLQQEAIEESLYRNQAMCRNNENSDQAKPEEGSSIHLPSVNVNDDDDQDPGMNLKRSPSWNEDEEDGWNSTATFYRPHPALATVESDEGDNTKENINQ